MPAHLTPQTSSIYELHLSGAVQKQEFEAVQAALAKDIDAGVKPRILAILDQFTGWERGADWNDLEFLFSHSNQIEKIAIVGPARWEPEALAFSGAGFRRAPVKFFEASRLAEARAWLIE